MVKVEIKQEPDPKDDDQLCFAQDFDFFQSFEGNDDNDNESSKEDQLASKVFKKKKSSSSLKLKETRPYYKFNPEERKPRGNRGIRRAKEAIRITPGELNNYSKNSH